MPYSYLLWKENGSESAAKAHASGNKKIVKERYGKCAGAGISIAASCCSIGVTKNPSFATEHGIYERDDLLLIPETALNLSRGCGNPTGFAVLHPGEIVVDFGCGALIRSWNGSGDCARSIRARPSTASSMSRTTPRAAWPRPSLSRARPPSTTPCPARLLPAQQLPGLG